ncbi:MAG TPA: biotin/lipoyl-binding protein, partial [Burkholderiales bacterium]|nr:biotin/lipoyl-binding protein [Burkholderiales bacterium]
MTPVANNNTNARWLKIASASLVLILAACGKQSPEHGANVAASPPAIPVTVKRVQPQRIPLALEAVGQAEGSRDVEIRARVGGILEKRLYTEGDAVKAGQTLFVIDRAPYELAVMQARAALAQERAKNEQAEREAQRLKALAQQKAISQREYDDATSALKQS